jgi:hypothetical protein
MVPCDAVLRAGDNSKVDLLVGDIYGSSYESIGLSADIIASRSLGLCVTQLCAYDKRARSFGKLAPMSEADMKTKFTYGSVVLATLHVMTRSRRQQGRHHSKLAVHDGQQHRANRCVASVRVYEPMTRALLAHLNAARFDIRVSVCVVVCVVECVHRGCSLVATSSIAIRTFGIDSPTHWSSGRRSQCRFVTCDGERRVDAQCGQPLFLLHDGYLGAVGAFLESSTLHFASTSPRTDDDDAYVRCACCVVCVLIIAHVENKRVDTEMNAPKARVYHSFIYSFGCSSALQRHARR